MQWLKRFKSLFILLFFIIGLIASLVFVRLVLYKSIDSDWVTAEGRGTKDGHHFGPILEVTLSNNSSWPLIVELPQGLTLKKDEEEIDVVILKSERVFLWFWPRTLNLVTYTLNSGIYLPNKESKYQLQPGEAIASDLEDILDNIQALYTQQEAFQAQVAVWTTSNQRDLKQIAADLGLEGQDAEDFVNKRSDEVKKIVEFEPPSPLLWPLIILVLLLVLIAGIVWWRRRKKKLIDYLEDWQKLGEGGMAEVWVAVDKRQQRPKKVVVKFPKEVSEPRKKQNIDYRFRREAELHQRLQHENIVPVFNSGWSPSPISIKITPCLIQKFIEGDTIKSLLEQQPQKRLPETTIFSIVEQLLDALKYIHGEDIVHRDLTSNNVMVDKSRGKVHLIDFGIATKLNSKETLEQGFPLFGTIPFYAPNLIIAEAAPSRDFYALAVLMIAMYGEKLPNTQFPEEAHHLLIANLPTYRIASGVKHVLWACLTGKYNEARKVRQDLRRAQIISDRASRQDEQNPYPAPPTDIDDDETTRAAAQNGGTS